MFGAAPARAHCQLERQLCKRGRETYAKLRFCLSSPTLVVELRLSRTSLTVSMIVSLLDVVTVDRLLMTS